MNCATHNDVEAVAYCRTCGKALCQKCARSIRGVIYCENCLAARLEGVQPQVGAPIAGFVPSAPANHAAPGSEPGSGPNPTVAGILGAIPFGVGAIYCGQYAKGLAHMLIFIGLVWGASSDPNGMGWLFGMGIPFLIVYQIFDAVRTARAIQSGQPAPDPFGLARTFSSGEKVDTGKAPTGALILIGLGVLFMLHNLAGLEIGARWIIPGFFVILGGWLLARRWGALGPTGMSCDCERCRYSSLTGPAILITIGILWGAHNIHEIGLFSWVGALLIVVGAIKVVQNSASTAGHVETLPPGAGMPMAPPPGDKPGPVAGPGPTPPSEVKNG